MRSRHRRSIDRFARAAALAATALACITAGMVGASHRGGLAQWRRQARRGVRAQVTSPCSQMHGMPREPTHPPSPEVTGEARMS
jgi:hypothetical protein